MKALDLALLVKGIGPVIREFVDLSIKGLTDRVGALEQRAATPGPRGDRGEKGEPGERGPVGPEGQKGLDGAPGPQGPQGHAGDRGERGEKGEKGERGPEGPAGPPGPAGRDGEVGPQGPAGEKGMAGPVGPSGQDGRDGRDGLPGAKGDQGERGEKGEDGSLLSLKALAAAMRPVLDDDGRTVKWCWADDTPVDGWAVKFHVPIYRGVWQDGARYEKGDSVTWGGSAWIAKADTTAKPGAADDAARAWQLAVKKGTDGKR